MRLFEVLVSLSLASCSLAGPIDTCGTQDTAIVGSLHRETRAPAATEAEDLTKSDKKEKVKNSSGKSNEGGYYKTYGGDAEGEKGYLKETYSKGDRGYKTLDTFHKQDGDKYGFERHVAYGKSREHDDEGSHSRRNKDHDGAGTIVYSRYTDAGENHGDAGESSHYAEGDGGNDHYEYHAMSEPEYEGYSKGESYSTGGGDNGSYENHSSYSSHYEKDGDEER